MCTAEYSINTSEWRVSLTIFIYNTDLLSLGIPLHASNDRLVAVVDHLFIPRSCRHEEGVSELDNAHLISTDVRKILMAILYKWMQVLGSSHDVDNTERTTQPTLIHKKN